MAETFNLFLIKQPLPQNIREEVYYQRFKKVNNLTINYTLNSGLEGVIFNSSDSEFGPIQYTIANLNHRYSVVCNLWSIDFEIVDWDKNPLTQGYINVSETVGSAVIEQLSLDVNGKATFRWYNTSSYYYKVYYENDDYNPSLVALNESTILRENR